MATRCVEEQPLTGLKCTPANLPGLPVEVNNDEFTLSILANENAQNVCARQQERVGGDVDGFACNKRRLCPGSLQIEMSCRSAKYVHCLRTVFDCGGVMCRGHIAIYPAHAEPWKA